MHYIPYVNSLDLLQLSYESARLIKDVVILDNRGFITLEPDPSTVIQLSEGHSIVKLPVSLTTSQIMNYMLVDSYSKYKSFFTWQHGDVEYPPEVGVKFTEYVSNLKGTDWGIIYTHHDLLAAYNVNNLLSIHGWDQHSFPYYYLDNDLASRLDKAGFKLIISGLGSDIIHHSSATINRDSFRKYVNSVFYPGSEHIYKERHGDYVVTNLGRDEYS